MSIEESQKRMEQLQAQLAEIAEQKAKINDDIQRLHALYIQLFQIKLKIVPDSLLFCCFSA